MNPNLFGISLVTVDGKTPAENQLTYQRRARSWDTCVD
jgi:hypothetical protein